MDTFSFTVIGGILVFVLGQMILTLIIIPSQELKKSLAGLSHSLLLYQGKLTNASYDKEISSEMKLKSAEIVSKTHVVLWYSMVRLIFGLPSRKNILSASRQLNLISYGMLTENSDGSLSSNVDYSLEITKAIKEIGRLLSIKTNYSN